MDKSTVRERERSRFAGVRVQLGSVRLMVGAVLLGAMVSQQALAQEASAWTAPYPNPQIAPEAVAAAWQELHAIRQREDLLWKQQADARPGLPATGVALGIPMFGVMLPFGALLVAQANSDAESGAIDDHNRRVGATLIGFGALGFVTFVAGTYMLVRLRRARMQRDEENRTLEERRSLLERIIEADWRAAPARLSLPSR